MDENIEAPISTEAADTATSETSSQAPVYTEREKQYYERIQKLEAENAKLKAAPAKSETKPSELPAEKPASADFDTLASFVEVTRDLQSGELSELRSEAKNLGIDPMKYITSKAGQAHLKELRQSAKSSEATPNPSNRVPTFNGKPVNSILSDENASASEKNAAWVAKVKGSRGANSSI